MSTLKTNEILNWITATILVAVFATEKSLLAMFRPPLFEKPVFALRSRIAYDKHRELQQTNRRTSICSDRTLGSLLLYLPFVSMFAGHLYWARIICLFANAPYVWVLIFSRSGYNAGGVALGAIGRCLPLVPIRQAVRSLAERRLLKLGTYVGPFQSAALIFS